MGNTNPTSRCLNKGDGWSPLQARTILDAQSLQRPTPDTPVWFAVTSANNLIPRPDSEWDFPRQRVQCTQITVPEQCSITPPTTEALTLPFPRLCALKKCP